MPNVIHKISFEICKNEKLQEIRELFLIIFIFVFHVGIIGRTGSGKSTLTLGLLRILELVENDDKTRGSISLDS